MKLSVSQKKLLAWGVHAYTMLGGVFGIAALIQAANGNIKASFLLLMITLVIDATDGMMARAINISKVLPNFDGSMVDNVIDTMTYIWIPILIMVKSDVLPFDWFWIFPTIAGMYAYGQTNMKSADAYFIGFPSYWNIVALYLWWLQPEALVASLFILIPFILTFIPTRYLYPSKNKDNKTFNLGFTIFWFGLITYMLLAPGKPDINLVYISLIYPIWYMVSSFYTELKLTGKIS